MNTSSNTRVFAMERCTKKLMKTLIKVANLIMGIAGIAILMYSVWMVGVCLRDYPRYRLSSWFVWASIGTGIMFCFMACMGYVAAATRSGLFLSCHVVFMFLLLVVESLLIADIFLNDDWDKDFPKDPTQRFHDFVDYVDSNDSTFMLLTLVLLASQATSIVLAMILRTMGSNRQPFVNNYEEQVSPASVPFLNHHIVAVPYAVGHPHPAPPDYVIAGTVPKDTDAVPYSEEEIRLLAKKGHPPY